jgi:hypothetical protein
MDITNYRTIPTIQITGVRTLTAAECEIEAEKVINRMQGCISEQMVRWYKRELRGWQRLAAERS